MLVATVLPLALFASFWSVFIALSDHRVRSDKEGIGLEELAAVFE